MRASRRWPKSPGTVLAVATLVCFTASASDDLSARIDRQIDAGCRSAGLTPSARADDPTFLRRVSLDLIGRIPTSSEARRFLDPDDPGKRDRLVLVRSLIASPAHAKNMATFWRRVWVPQADAEGMGKIAEELEAWLAGRFRRGDRLDRIVRDLIVASDLPVIGGRGEKPPAGFLLANELKAENLAGSTSRAFLGLNLACAQCHDHPFADWSRDQFWELAAFFAPTSGGKRPMIRVSEGNRTVSARPPDGKDLKWSEGVRPEQAREALADWVTSVENPWFARQSVNELWAHFFGAALVGPFDDPAAENPPANVALLDDLAGEFARSGFDVNRLTAAVVRSECYQRAAGPLSRTELERRRFAAAAIRNLTGEQLFDSLRTAAGFPPARDDGEAMRLRRERRQFANAFQVARPTTDARTVLQALTLMNGSLTRSATTPGKSPTLAAVSAPRFEHGEPIETLFLATLTRLPTAAERKSMAEVLAAAVTDRERETAIADVFWALINCSEFHSNH